MYKYRVTTKAFYNGVLYEPGKRDIIVLEVPFKENPSWVEPMVETITPTERSKKPRKPRTKVDTTVESKSNDDDMMVF